MATIHPLPLTEEPSNLRNFINRLTHAQRSDLETLVRDARQLNNQAVHILKAALVTGSDDQRNIAATVAIAANLLRYTPVQDAFYACLLDSTDTLLHELLLPAIVELGKGGATKAGETIASYIKRGDSEQIRYANVLRVMHIDPTKYRDLPKPRIVGSIGR